MVAPVNQICPICNTPFKGSDCIGRPCFKCETGYSLEEVELTVRSVTTPIDPDFEWKKKKSKKYFVSLKKGKKMETERYFDIVELAEENASTMTADQSFQLEFVMDHRVGNRMATRKFKRMLRRSGGEINNFNWDAFFEFIEKLFELLSRYGIFSQESE